MVQQLILGSSCPVVPLPAAGLCAQLKDRPFLESHCASMELTEPEALPPSTEKDEQILVVWRKWHPSGRPGFYGWCLYPAQFLVAGPGTVGCVLEALSRLHCTQLATFTQVILGLFFSK